jgi:hypothetical protein
VQQYRAGTVPFTTVFQLEVTQFQVQDQLAVAQGNIALFLIEVYRALGGGWELRCQEKDGKQAAAEVPVAEKVAAPKEAPPAPAPEETPPPRPLPADKVSRKTSGASAAPALWQFFGTANPPTKQEKNP